MSLNPCYGEYVRESHQGKEPVMFEKISPEGVVLRSVHPFHEEGPKDRHVALFLLWSWQFTVRRNIGGLFKPGKW